MKILIELLKNKLPGRGGWPKSAHGVVQDSSGQVWFFKNGKPYYTGKIWGADKLSKDFDWVDWEISLPLAEDNHYAIITREQYEAAIAAPDTEWDGKGLPPVGCECEYETIKDNWRKCRVMYLGEKCNIVRTDEWGEVCCVLSVKFRPIIAEVDRKRNKFANACIEMDRKGNYPNSHALFCELYDEIAEGKIPGVMIMPAE